MTKNRKDKGVGWYPVSVLATGIIGTARIRRGVQDAPTNGAENAFDAISSAVEDAAMGGLGVLKIESVDPRKVEKAAKFGNRRTMARGIWFASGKEAARYEVLVTRLLAGEIWDLAIQVPFELLPAVEIGGVRQRAKRYVADFVYETPAGRVVEDVKGFRTPEYKLKRHMMKALLGIEISEV